MTIDKVMILNVLVTIYAVSAIAAFVFALFMEAHNTGRVTVGTLCFISFLTVLPLVNTGTAWWAFTDTLKVLRVWERFEKVLDFELWTAKR